MKKFLLSFLIIGFVFSPGFGQTPKTWFTFDDAADQTAPFSGSLYKGIMENPSKTGINTSDSVGLGFTGANSWDGFYYSFGSPLNLSQIKTFTMKVYHPTLSGETRLQFRPGDLKLDVMYTTPGEWAELTWEIPDGYDGVFDNVLICFAHDRAVADEEWYFDDLNGAPTYMPTGPETFYSTVSIRPEITGFQGAVYDGVVDNPGIDDTNGNPFSGKSLTGTDTWSGLYWDLAAPIDFTEKDNKFQMMVYSDSIGNARIQLEGATPKMKISVPYTTPGQWQHLEFDPANAADGDTSLEYNRIVLVFDDADTDVGEEWYFDQLTGPSLSLGYVEPTRDYLDFETGDNPDITSFQGALFGGVAENPLKDDVNGSDSVGVFYTGTDGWSAMQYWLPNYVNFSAGYNFKLKVYNADSTGRVRFWLEDKNASKKIKAVVNYTTPGHWQEVTVDTRESVEALPGDAQYLKMLLCFDDEDTDVGEEWFFDDLMGPPLVSKYYNTGTFMVKDSSKTASTVEIVLDNNDSKIALADDGSGMNMWTVNVENLPTGDHLMDVYIDGVIADGADDVAITIGETLDPAVISYVYIPSVKVNALFTITVTGTSSTDFAIDINNSGSTMTLYDDGTHGDVTSGDGVWSLLVNDLAEGGHVMDLYDGGTLVTTADDVAFTLATDQDPNVVAYTYKVTSIRELKLMGFNVYPNPANQYVTISANSDKLDNICIYNLQGRELKRIQSINASELTIDISGINPGVYYMRITGDQDNYGLAKIVIK
jgi:hypothetical protein